MDNMTWITGEIQYFPLCPRPEYYNVYRKAEQTGLHSLS